MEEEEEEEEEEGEKKKKHRWVDHFTKPSYTAVQTSYHEKGERTWVWRQSSIIWRIHLWHCSRTLQLITLLYIELISPLRSIPRDDLLIRMYNDVDYVYTERPKTQCKYHNGHQSQANQSRTAQVWLEVVPASEGETSYCEIIAVLQ